MAVRHRSYFTDLAAIFPLPLTAAPPSPPHLLCVRPTDRPAHTYVRACVCAIGAQTYDIDTSWVESVDNVLWIIFFLEVVIKVVSEGPKVRSTERGV